MDGSAAGGGGDDGQVTGRPPGQRLGKALGVASFALGLPQVAVPGRFAALVGVDPTPGTRALVRGVGVREIAAGSGILAGSRPRAGLWARVAGDAMDLALLTNAVRSRSRRGRVAAATGAAVGITLLDLVAAARLSRRGRPSRQETGTGGVRVKAGVTVNRTIDEAYAFWRDFSRLPSFMAHLDTVTVGGDGRSHWKANGPAGVTVEWDAVVVEDIVGELIAWRSVEGADVTNSGVVRFRTGPGGRGTEVRVEMAYEPPAGGLGSTVAKLFGAEPQQQLEDDLRRFKQVLETGDVVRSEGSPEGTHARRQLKQRPGQPVG